MYTVVILLKLSTTVNLRSEDVCFHGDSEVQDKLNIQSVCVPSLKVLAAHRVRSCELLHSDASGLSRMLADVCAHIRA